MFCILLRMARDSAAGASLVKAQSINVQYKLTVSSKIRKNQPEFDPFLEDQKNGEKNIKFSLFHMCLAVNRTPCIYLFRSDLCNKLLTFGQLTPHAGSCPR